MAQKTKKCEEVMSQSTGSGKFMALIRVGDPEIHQALAKMEWVPPSLKSKGDTVVRPEALDGFGAPWVLTSSDFHTRQGLLQQPLWGMPQLLFTDNQPVLLFSWDASALVRLGKDIELGTGVVAKMLKCDQAEWLEKHVSVGVLPAHSTAWFPLAWNYTLVNMSAEMTSVTMQPMCDTKLVQTSNMACTTQLVVSLLLFYVCCDSPLRAAQIWAFFGLLR